mgnify:CR=1 FL=1
MTLPTAESVGILPMTNARGSCPRQVVSPHRGTRVRCRRRLPEHTDHPRADNPPSAALEGSATEHPVPIVGFCREATPSSVGSAPQRRLGRTALRNAAANFCRCGRMHSHICRLCGRVRSWANERERLQASHTMRYGILGKCIFRTVKELDDVRDKLIRGLIETWLK